MNNTNNTNDAKELTKEQWGEWKRHPVSKVLFQYLKDNQELTRENLLKAFNSGNLSASSSESILRDEYRCKVMQDIIDLKIEDIQLFNTTHKGITDEK